MEIEKLQQIVIELSERLADDTDYESNLKPKCQALLDYFSVNQDWDTAEQWMKEDEDRAESDMIVCYTRCFYGEHERHTSSDYIEAFRKENKRAFARYEELLKEDDIYSASICAVIDSTDYDGMWDSEVGEISNG